MLGLALLAGAGAGARAQEAGPQTPTPMPTPVAAYDERLTLLLDRVGESVARYHSELFRIAFTETLRREELRKDMTAKKSKEFVFDTIVEREALSADEEDYYPKVVRRLRTVDGKPKKSVGRGDADAGLAVSSLGMLLPKHRDRFVFSLDGEETFDGRRVHRLRIVWREQSPPRVVWKRRLVGMSFGVFAPAVYLVRVDAENYDVLSFESRLAEPFEFESPRTFGFGRLGPSRRLRYAARDYHARFRRERFKDPEQTLLVPVRAEWVNVIEGAGRPRQRATLNFSDYRRYRSDVKVIEEQDPE